MSSDEYKNALGFEYQSKSGGCAGMTYDMNYVEQLIDGDEKIEVEGVNVFIDPKQLCISLVLRWIIKSINLHHHLCLIILMKLNDVDVVDLLKFKLFKAKFLSFKPNFLL